MRSIGALLLATAAAATAPATAAAEEPREAAEAAEVSEPGVRLEATSSLFARYATSSASVLYAACAFGKAGVFFGLVDNPRSGYQERIGGVSSRAVGRRAELTFGLAAADASDSMYLQTYLLPSASAGPLSLGATIVWYEPLEDEGVRQLSFDPVTVLVSLTPHLGAGGLYALSYSAGDDLTHRAGPAVQVRIPPGALKLEIIRAIANGADEVRVGFAAGF
jgi:hypothetical protein